MAKIKPLKENLLFKDFSDKEIAIISQIVSEKSIPKNTPLYVENMLGETLFIVKSGSVQVSRNFAKIGEQVLVTLGPGDFFGEMALLNGGPRLVSAKTAEETELLIITGDDFKALIEKEPQVCLKLLLSIVKVFTNRIRENMSLTDEFLAWRFK